MKKTIQIKTARGKYLELKVPASIIVCPICEGKRAFTEIKIDCGLCEGANVLLTWCNNFETKYPTIYSAYLRLELENERTDWEAYGERVWGC